MLRDSRYTVEQWLRGHVRPGDVVGFVFPEQYYPGSRRFNSAKSTSFPNSEGQEPAYFVLNADYAAAEPPASEIGQLVAGLERGQLGYTPVFRFRQPGPWPWLPGQSQELVGDRKERPITSVLRHINPSSTKFSRRPAKAPEIFDPIRRIAHICVVCDVRFQYFSV